MRRSAVGGPPRPCADRFELFLEPASESKVDRLERETEAKALCASCSVRPACLAVALANKEKWDIWGGLNADERRELLRERAKAGA